MNKVIALASRCAPTQSGRNEKSDECKILLFTGVRYERLVEQAANLGTATVPAASN